MFTCSFHWNKMHSWITAFCLKNLGPTKYWKIVFAMHATLRNKSKDLIGIEIKCRSGTACELALKMCLSSRKRTSAHQKVTCPYHGIDDKLLTWYKTITHSPQIHC